MRRSLSVSASWKEAKGLPYLWQQRNWPRRLRWSAEALLPRIGEARHRQGLLLGKLGGLGFDLRRGVELDMVTDEAIATSAIEGERLERRSVRSSVARRLGLSAAGLPAPDRRVDGLVAMLCDATGRFDEPLTCTRVKAWHRELFPEGDAPSRRLTVGAWRRGPVSVVSGPLGREHVHYDAPPAASVPGELRELLSWWTDSRGSVEGLLRAGVAHLWFLTIHPFDDGNGRVARAIADMALAQDEKLPRRFYSMSAQIEAERGAYYESLERAQRGDGELTEWLTWFLGCLGRALERADREVEKVVSRVRFWQEHEMAGLGERQVKVVNRLLEAGQGGFEGGLSTRKFAAIGKCSRATAQREIGDLLSRGLLKRRAGGGRSTSYDLNW